MMWKRSLRLRPAQMSFASAVQLAAHRPPEKTAVNIKMTMVIFVDSRMRTNGGSDSDFEIELRETIHLNNARVRVDHLTFTDSFLTTDATSNLYLSNGAGGLTTVAVPEGAYAGES